MSRLEQKMCWAASAMLNELPLSEIDDPGSGNEVKRPAEPPADCAEVLLQWFDAGLVGVMTIATDRDLPPTEARDVLANHEAWSPKYSLIITDAGGAAFD